MKEILPHVWSWSVFSEAKGINFNGYYLRTAEGSFVIDPPSPKHETWQEIDRLEGPYAVYLTNKDHSRAAVDFKERYGIPIYLHEADREAAGIPIDHTFKDGETLPGGFKVVTIPASKSPGESAFLLSAGPPILFIGDAVIGRPAGRLSLLPEPKIPNHQAAAAALQEVLGPLDFDALLLGDGASFLTDGKKALTQLIQQYQG